MNINAKVFLGAVVVCVSIALGAGAATMDVDQAIQQYRTGVLTVHTRPGASVCVEQIRHEFWFGAAISSSAFAGWAKAEDQRQYKETFLANFNAGVTENALKWHSMERRQGQVDYTVLDAIMAWAGEHDITMRGHCLFWGISGRVQDWIKQLNDDELREALKTRAITMARRYQGQFAEYDLNNEMIHGNYYADRLGPGITKQMAVWVKQADPKARLSLNDYDILTGNRLDDYLQQIRDLLAEGAPIDAIGVQGHLHGESFDPNALRQALDALAKTGLPICVTEFNFPGQRASFYGHREVKLTPEQERAKAEALVQYYRICFAHPAVQGILMWGFWEGANWIPQSSLYRRDWTPTPAAEAYRDLVFKQWWTRWEGKTDATGQCHLRAFFGKHRVTVDGQERVVDLRQSAGSATVSFE